MNVLINLEDEIDGVKYYIVTIVFKKDDFVFNCEISFEDNFNTIRKWIESGKLAGHRKRKIQFGNGLFLDMYDNGTSSLTLCTNVNSMQITFKNEVFMTNVINKLIKFLNENPDAKFY